MNIAKALELFNEKFNAFLEEKMEPLEATYFLTRSLPYCVQNILIRKYYYHLFLVIVFAIVIGYCYCCYYNYDYCYYY